MTLKRMKRANKETVPDSYLSTPQVAAALGVSVTTVKRWVDEEILPAYRTAGGHRKLLAEDVLRAARAGHLPQVDLSALMTPQGKAIDPSRLTDQFLTAIREVDLDRVQGVLLQARRQGLAMEAIADRILAPGLTLLGRLWETGRFDVMTEQLVSEACRSAMFEIESGMKSQGRRSRPVAVGGAAEGDFSVLPSLLARLTLIEAGWEAINLGPHTPFSAFSAAIKRYSPRLVWVSLSHVGDVTAFLRDYSRLFEEASARGIAVAIGGSGLTPELRMRMQYTMYGDGLSQFAEFARSLNPLPKVRSRGRPVKGD